MTAAFIVASLAFAVVLGVPWLRKLGRKWEGWE